ncbi:MAG: hypothetical protein AAFY98_02845 [Verrucomicrobiota bacterium]
MYHLIEIIKEECLPQRNCMLTIYDPENETAFLYFKEAQLIEVNAGKLWGKDALLSIQEFTIATYDLSEIPIGIKRTIWESLDVLVAELIDQESANEMGEMIRNMTVDELQESAVYDASSIDDPLQKFVEPISQINGFMAFYKQRSEGMRKLAGKTPTSTLSSDWIQQFTERVSQLGNGLSAGALLEWYLEFDELRIWRVEIGTDVAYILSDTASTPEDFEMAFREVLG